MSKIEGKVLVYHPDTYTQPPPYKLPLQLIGSFLMELLFTLSQLLKPLKYFCFIERTEPDIVFFV